MMIERIETSCPCLATTPGSIRISPGESKVLAIEFDPSAEPDFRGGLSVDVTGHAGERVAFHTLVNVDVRTQSPKGVGEFPQPNEEGRP
jgi:hypothetical protein